ncbi:uncharacterized protein LOC118268205 [Spodoptera frugiperda]|uniref:Uncharacterized protein LOC118268205 n=1 Tax=Spodoptera frugiperda TaxID=7108 RepID=A0A9R0EJQ1_SPOFR|nr:uncharacterized protein LOC118268205 [Spodoptera frugiperda]
MKSLTLLCVLAVVCSALAAPEVEGIEQLKRDVNLVADTSKLIEELVANLRKSGQEAIDSVATFNEGIKNEALAIRDKIVADVQKFRNRVTEAVENVMKRISNTNVAVKECVDSHRSAAASVFNETLASTLVCVDERIADVSKEISHLMTIAKDAVAAGNLAMDDMRECTTNNTNLLTVGGCLAKVALKIELKSVGFLGQSAMTVGRINIGISSLPAALDVCAGMRLIQTGIQTGKIIVEIGSCSATGIFNALTGKPITSTLSVF